MIRQTAKCELCAWFGDSVDSTMAEGERSVPYLSSSAIRRVEYDASSRRMTIWFKQGGQGYHFCGVPAHIYEGLVNAASAGTYYDTHIRDRYQC
jgi:hypothetical protein